jgi:hypothetical protein
MKIRLSIIQLYGSLALLVVSGCTTNRAMKGSPFYTGDFKSPPNSIVTNRLPAWPLLYYRDPALSICWPFIESIKDESFAVRPLFSVYDYNSPTNREWNILWPLVQNDAATGHGRAVPFFWGDDYVVGFPLWWHFNDGVETSDLMLPLWWYSSDDRSKHIYSLLYGYSQEGDRSSWLAPLLLSGGSYGPDHASTHLVWPLSHWGHDGEDTFSHLFPLWYWDSKESTFLSIPWSHWRSRGRDNYFTLPLLGGGASDGKGAGEFWALAGLYNHEWTAQGTSSDYLFPLYFYGEDEYLFTLLFGYKGRADDRYSYYFTPLIGSSKSGPIEKAWAFPLWHSTENTDTQTTSGHFLWSTWKTETNHARSQFFPFWGHVKDSSPTREYERSSAMLWLYGDRRERSEKREETTSYIFPVWYNGGHTESTGESYNRNLFLLGLYDSKHEVTRDSRAPGGLNDYSRQSVLGYAWRREEVNGDVSVDFFPGVAYDKKKDGFTQTAFLYRLFRWQRDAEGKRKLDLFFIPLIRD